MISISASSLVLANQNQAVAVSQTNQVVSNTLSLSCVDQMQIAFEVTAASVSGTAGVVKLQHSFDATNWTDVDATNAKVTIAANGRYALSLSPYNSTLAAKFPLWPYVRFVATTGTGDAFTVTKILVTSTRP